MVSSEECPGRRKCLELAAKAVNELMEIEIGRGEKPHDGQFLDIRESARVAGDAIGHLSYFVEQILG